MEKGYKNIPEIEVGAIEHDALMYARYMLNDEITDPNDPTVIMAETYDRSLNDMKEDLLRAVN